MRKDPFCYSEYGENNKIREEGLKMQAIDTEFEAEKEERL